MPLLPSKWLYSFAHDVTSVAAHQTLPRFHHESGIFPVGIAPDEACGFFLPSLTYLPPPLAQGNFTHANCTKRRCRAAPGSCFFVIFVQKRRTRHAAAATLKNNGFTEDASAA
jgi:hypothetical protein